MACIDHQSDKTAPIVWVLGERSNADWPAPAAAGASRHICAVVAGNIATVLLGAGARKIIIKQIGAPKLPSHCGGQSTELANCCCGRTKKELLLFSHHKSI